MSEILRDWLNHGVGLSRHVSDIDRDFASGYLLGDLLVRTHQAVSSECTVRDGHDSAARVDNFVTLEPFLRDLGVPFDSRVVADVIAEKPGAATRLVFQVRTALHAKGVKGKTEKKKGMKMHEGHDAKDEHVALRTREIKTTEEKRAHAEQRSRFFEARLRETVSLSTTTVKTNARLGKFVAEGERQIAEERKRIEDERRAEEEKVRTRRREIRAKESTMREAFRDWEKNAFVDHESLKAKRRTREKEDLKFKLTQKEKRIEKDRARRRAAEAEVASGIDEFQRTLANTEAKRQAMSLSQTQTQKMGEIEQQQGGADGDLSATSTAQTVERPADHIRRLKAHLPSAQEMSASADAYLGNVRDRAERDRRARAERDARRRRLLLDQQRSHAAHAASRRENTLLRGIVRDTLEERDLTRELLRVREKRDQIVRHRVIRERVTRERREADERERREAEGREAVRGREEVRRKGEEESRRERENREKEAEAKKKKAHAEAKFLTMQILAIAEAVAEHREKFNDKVASAAITAGAEDGFNPAGIKVPAAQWREWMALFVAGEPISEELVQADFAKSREEEAKVKVESQIEDAAAMVLDDRELEDYLGLDGDWTVRIEELDDDDASKVVLSSKQQQQQQQRGGKAKKGDPKGAKQGRRTPSPSPSRRGSPRGSRASSPSKVIEEAADAHAMEASDARQGSSSSSSSSSSSKRRFPAMNAKLADIVMELDLIVNPPEPEPEVDPLPAYPIRCCVTGAPFAGKSSAAAELAARFGIAVIRPNDLVATAVACHTDEGKLEEARVAWEKHLARVAVDESVSEDKIGSDNEDEDSDLDKDSDNNNVDNNINKNKKNKNKMDGEEQQQVGESSEKKSARSIFDLPNDGRDGRPIAVDPALLVEVGASLHRSLVKGKPAADEDVVKLIGAAARAVDSRRGWVIDGFPSTENQAEALERELSGFVRPTTGKGGKGKKAGGNGNNKPGSASKKRGSTVALSASKKDKSALAAAEAAAQTEANAAGPRRGGVDLVMILDAPRDVIIRRCAGLRVDPSTGDEYVLGGADPTAEPPEKIVPSLVRPEIAVAAETNLPSRLDAWSSTGKQLTEFQSKFFGNVWNVIVAEGIPAEEKPGGKAPSASASKKKNAKKGKGGGKVTATIATVEENDPQEDDDRDNDQGGGNQYPTDVGLRRKVNERCVLGVEHILEIKAAEEEAEEERRRFEEALEMERRAEEEELEEIRRKEAEAAKAAELERLRAEAEAEADDKKKKGGRGGNKKSASGGKSSASAAAAAAAEEEEKENSQESKDEKPEQEQLKEAEGPKIDPEFASVLVDQWDHLEGDYCETLREVFRDIREQRKSALEHYGDLRQILLSFLARDDSVKMELVREFQKDFNAISPAEARGLASVKEELHLRTSELEDALWSICDDRRDEATVRRSALIRSAKANEVLEGACGSHDAEENDDTVRGGGDDGEHEGEEITQSADVWAARRAKLLSSSVARVAQAECDRFLAVARIVSDFSDAAAGRPAPRRTDPPKAIWAEVLPESIAGSSVAALAEFSSFGGGPHGGSNVKGGKKKDDGGKKGGGAKKGKSDGGKSSGKRGGGGADASGGAGSGAIPTLDDEEAVNPPFNAADILEPFETAMESALTLTDAESFDILAAIGAASAGAHGDGHKDGKKGGKKGGKGSKSSGTHDSAHDASGPHGQLAVAPASVELEEDVESEVRERVASTIDAERIALSLRLQAVRARCVALSDFMAELSLDFARRSREWVRASWRAEVAAVNSLTAMVRECIESGSALASGLVLARDRFEIRLADVQVEPEREPSPPSAREPISEWRFTGSQISNLSRHLSAAANGGHSIATAGLAETIAQLGGASFGVECLPPGWLRASRSALRRLAGQLDYDESQFVDWRSLVIAALPGQCVPTSAQLAAARAWFDSAPQPTTVEDTLGASFWWLPASLVEPVARCFEVANRDDGGDDYADDNDNDNDNDSDNNSSKTRIDHQSMLLHFAVSAASDGEGALRAFSVVGHPGPRGFEVDLAQLATIAEGRSGRKDSAGGEFVDARWRAMEMRFAELRYASDEKVPYEAIGEVLGCAFERVDANALLSTQ